MLDTAIGIDNHIFTLVRHIIRFSLQYVNSILSTHGSEGCQCETIYDEINPF